MKKTLTQKIYEWLDWYYPEEEHHSQRRSKAEKPIEGQVLSNDRRKTIKAIDGQDLTRMNETANEDTANNTSIALSDCNQDKFREDIV